MKTPSDFLWRLIKSLSRTEKLFFTRNFNSSSFQQQRLYLKLFNAISAQKKYNEAELLKKFQPALNKKNIAFQKNYLQKQVCESLIFYEYQRNEEYEIIRLRLLIRLYRRKGLLDEALLLWKKAIQLARKAESFALSSLLKAEFEKMLLISGSHTSYGELLKLFSENAITYEDYAALITLRDIYAEIILIKRNAHFEISESDQQKIIALLEKVDSYTNAYISPSFWYRHYFFMCRISLLYLLNKSPLALKELKSLHQEWMANPKFIRLHGEHYLEVLYMINYCGIQCGDFEFVSMAYADKSNQLLNDSILTINFEAYRFLALSRIFNKTANYQAVKHLLYTSKNKIAEWEPFLNMDINRTLQLSSGISFFVLEDYDHALSFIKGAVTYITAGIRKELFSVGQMLLLLITYSMNNEKLFEAQYRTTYGFFYKRKKHAFEKAVMECLRRTFYMTDNKEKIKEYQKAIAIINQNSDDIFQRNIFTIFNFFGWLESKVQRISYRRYVEQKVKKEKLQYN